MDAAWEREHLWLYLLALGFEPNKCHEDVSVGRNMFDKPNQNAFALIAVFLFAKLDEDRVKETFRNWSLQVGASPEFRKQCCIWLREMSNEKERNPNITPSSLISPAGDKFVHIVYQFARHVMVDGVKKFSVGTCIPFAEAVTLHPEDMYIAKARHRIGYNKLLQILQKQDVVIQEYEKKARVLIKEIEETKSEYAIMQVQFSGMKQNDKTKSDTTERTEKVRRMWTHIMEMLTSLKKDKEVVDSVLENCVQQCILDGSDVVLRLPRLLVQKIESDSNFTGNIYEDGKLKFLAVIQVLNEGLRMLRNEHCLCELKELHRIENMVKYCNKLLEDLNTKRISSVMLESLEVPESRDLLIKNHLHTETRGGNKTPVPPQILKNGKEGFLISETGEDADEDGDVSLTKSLVEKDLLEKARDELAEEVAKAVMSESPDGGEEKGMLLDDLISSLCFNPFLTRKEIPRTPENMFPVQLTQSTKKTASKSEEELQQTHNGDESESCRSDLSPTPGERKKDEFYSPVVVFSLDGEFIKTPLPKSNERKYSLSCLLISSEQLEKMASTAQEQLNEKLGTKEQSPE